jgi:choline dehydrogenase-like flavoprotein
VVSEVRLHGVHLGELEVHGVTGLRIMDTSVNSLIRSAHTTSTVYAVAEKVVDITNKKHGINVSLAYCLE